MKKRSVTIHNIDTLCAENKHIKAFRMNRDTLREFVALAGKKTRVIKKQRVYVSPLCLTMIPLIVDQKIEGENVYVDDEE